LAPVERVEGWRASVNPQEEAYMEAGQAGLGPREADVAPAPDPTAGRTAGIWTPADPGPLGLAGFAMTTFVLSIYNAHLVNITGTPVVLPLALAYGGIAQLLAGMWEFRTGNTFGAVAFSSFGAFWISFYFLAHGPVVGLLPKNLAVYLYGWAIFTTYMFIASLRTTGAVALVFVLLAATFWILAIGNAGSNVSIIKIGGWVGLVTAAAAWYASFAAVTNATFGRVILPVLPLKR
jgi:succinate-acetate transporter protein